mgnify:CR=1 FL=1
MKKKWFSLIVTGIVFLILVFLLSRIGILDILSLMAEAKPLFLGLAFLSMLLMLFLRNFISIKAARKLTGKTISYIQTMPIFFSGILFNALTPGANLGGEPLKAHYLSKKYKGRKSTYLAALFFQLFLYHVVLFTFLFFSLVMLIYFFSFPRIRFLTIVVSFLLVFIICLVLVLFLVRDKAEWFIGKFSFLYIFFSKFENKEDFEEYLVERYKNFAISFKGLLKLKFFFPLLVVAFVVRLLFYLSFYFVFMALEIDFPFVYVVMATTFVLFLADISTVPEGIGVSEGGLIFVYGIFNLSPLNAGAVALLGRGVRYFYSFFIGFLSHLYMEHSFFK